MSMGRLFLPGNVDKTVIQFGKIYACTSEDEVTLLGFTPDGGHVRCSKCIAAARLIASTCQQCQIWRADEAKLRVAWESAEAQKERTLLKRE